MLMSRCHTEKRQHAVARLLAWASSRHVLTNIRVRQHLAGLKTSSKYWQSASDVGSEKPRDLKLSSHLRR